MQIITAVELRERLKEIIDLILEEGEEIILQYRGNKRIKLVPVDSSKPKQKTKAQKIFEYFESPEYQKQLKKRKPNPLFDEKNPRQEKMNFRAERAKKYMK